MTSKSPFPNTNAAITISKPKGKGERWTLKIGDNTVITAADNDGLVFNANNIATANGQFLTQFEDKPQKDNIDKIAEIVQKIHDATSKSYEAWRYVSRVTYGTPDSRAKAALNPILDLLTKNTFYATYAAAAAADAIAGTGAGAGNINEFFYKYRIMDDGYGRNVKAGMAETYEIATKMLSFIDYNVNRDLTQTVSALKDICGKAAVLGAPATGTYLALEKFKDATGKTITKVSIQMQIKVKTAYDAAAAAADAAAAAANDNNKATIATTKAATATTDATAAAEALQTTAYEADAAAAVPAAVPAAAPAAAADWTTNATNWKNVANKWAALYEQIGGTETSVVTLSGGKKTRHNRNRRNRKTRNRNRH